MTVRNVEAESGARGGRGGAGAEKEEENDDGAVQSRWKTIGREGEEVCGARTGDGTQGNGK